MHLKIGETAGVVWIYLKEHGATSSATLAKETKIDKTMLERSIGWLAREGKVEFQKKGNSVVMEARE